MRRGFPVELQLDQVYNCSFQMPVTQILETGWWKCEDLLCTDAKVNVLNCCLLLINFFKNNFENLLLQKYPSKCMIINYLH